MKERELTVERVQYSARMNTQRVGGFTDDELYRLKRMPNAEAEEALLEMLDKRNNGLGTRWACGYGVQSVWFDNEYAYVNIGNSCD